MCEKRITNLRRLFVKSNRPVQPVNPEIVITSNTHESNNEENEKKIDKYFRNGIVEKSVSIYSVYFLIIV